MEFWYILGIEPTKDVEEIKKAYKKQLKINHPEDNPEGFKTLRVALEKAIEYAVGNNEQGDSKYDDTPVGKWMQRVDNLYGDYWARIEADNWEKLFQEDVFFCIDTTEEAKEKLIVFLMKNHYLPSKVWKKIVAALEIEENIDELAEKYPRDFLEYVVNQAKYADSFNYYLFEPKESGLPFDEYISAYYSFRNAVSEQKVEEAESIRNTLENMPIYHPFFSISKIHLLLMTDRETEAKTVSDDLYENYPDEPECVISRAGFLFRNDRYEDALELYSKYDDSEATSFSAKCGKADCFLALKRFKEAQKIYKDLLMEHHYDGYVHYKLTVCNDSLIEIYNKNIENNPADFDSKLELGWCYYQNNKIGEAYEVIKGVKTGDSRDMDFCYLQARCLFGIGKEKKADNLFIKWCELFEIYKDEEGEIIKRNNDREELVYYFRAEIAIKRKQYEEARIWNAKALKIMKLDKDLIVAQKGTILSKLGNDNEAIECLQKALSISFDNVQAMVSLGDCYKNVGRMQEAYSSYERAIYTVPYLTEGYVKLIRMLLESGQVDQAFDMIDDYRKSEIESEAIDFCQALVFREKDDYKNAAALIKKIEAKLEAGAESDLFFIIDKDEYTYIKADTLVDTGDILGSDAIDMITKILKRNKNSVRYTYTLAALFYRGEMYEEALKYYKKALILRPNNETIMMAIANSYREMKDKRELDMLMSILKINPDHPYAHGQIGEFYENRACIESALIYYTKQLEIEPSDYFYISRGIMYMELCKAEKALEDFKEAADRNSTNPYAYYNTGRTLLRMGQPYKAQKYLEKALEVCGEDKRPVFFNQLGKCYSRQRKDVNKSAERIRKLYDEMQEKYPLDPSIQLNRGKALRALGFIEEAIECFEKGIILDRDNKYKFGEQIIITVMDTSLDKERALEYIKRFKKKDGADNIISALYYYELYFGSVQNAYKWATKVPDIDDLSLYNRAVAVRKLAETKKTNAGKRQLLEEAEECLKGSEKIARNNIKYGTDRLQGYKRLALIALEKNNILEAKEYLEEAEKSPICDYCLCPVCYELLMIKARIASLEKKKELALEYAKCALEACCDDGEIKLLIKEIEEI